MEIIGVGWTQLSKPFLWVVAEEEFREIWNTSLWCIWCAFAEFEDGGTTWEGMLLVFRS